MVASGDGSGEYLKRLNAKIPHQVRTDEGLEATTRRKPGLYLEKISESMQSITRKQRDLQHFRYENFVACCEGSPRLEAIAVAFREENHLTLGKLLMAATELHYHCNRAFNSHFATLGAYYVGSEKLSRQQQNALNCELSFDERLLLISFLAREQFCVLKEGK